MNNKVILSQGKFYRLGLSKSEEIILSGYKIILKTAQPRPKGNKLNYLKLIQEENCYIRLIFNGSSNLLILGFIRSQFDESIENEWNNKFLRSHFSNFSYLQISRNSLIDLILLSKDEKIANFKRTIFQKPGLVSSEYYTFFHCEKLSFQNQNYSALIELLKVEGLSINVTFFGEYPDVKTSLFFLIRANSKKIIDEIISEMIHFLQSCESLTGDLINTRKRLIKSNWTLSKLGILCNSLDEKLLEQITTAILYGSQQTLPIKDPYPIIVNGALINENSNEESNGIAATLVKETDNQLPLNSDLKKNTSSNNASMNSLREDLVINPTIKHFLSFGWKIEKVESIQKGTKKIIYLRNEDIEISVLAFSNDKKKFPIIISSHEE